MIIYESIKKEFLDHVVDGSLIKRICDAYQQNNLTANLSAEGNAWRNSLSRQ